MVRKQQIWGEERQTQNEGKYSEVLRDRMLTGIAVVARRAHVLPHLGRVSLNCHIFSRLGQGRLCFFFLVLWCIFSFQEVQWFVVCFLITLILLSPFPIWSLFEQE